MSDSSFPLISPPDEHVYARARQRQAELTKPAGSLGRLEDLGCWIAACQGQCPPQPLNDVTTVVFAGDHGIASHGVSAYPTDVSVQMASNIESGGAAVSVLAKRAGTSVCVIDVSLNSGSEADTHICDGSGSIDREDAMSRDEYRRALQVGIDAADREIDSGVDLLIAGDLGIGNTTPAAALIGALTNTEPVVVVGRGTGIDDNGWKRKTAAIRDAMYRVHNIHDEPASVLQFISSPDITAMVGFLAQAAVRRTPVILDGIVVCAAALVAEKLAPGAKQWWVAGHRSVEPAQKIALRELELTPVVDLGMRLGEGSGAVVTLMIVNAAVDIIRNMATFDEAGVSTAADAEDSGAEDSPAEAPGAEE